MNLKHTAKKLLPKNWGKPVIVDPATLNQDLPDEYISNKVDLEGGVGAVYRIVTSSWAAFKNQVMGHGYDIDGWYGWQCWDAAALLWQQFGRALLTGNGLAIGAWDLKRATNKYKEFDLITNVNALKPGDVVAMRPNHIGFFDGYDGGYMIIVSQNQGGAHGPHGGMAFNRIRITKNAFAGAFRLKKWHPAPAPKPAPGKKSNEAIAREVIQGKWGNGPDRVKRLTKAGYNYKAVQAIVNKLV